MSTELCCICLDGYDGDPDCTYFPCGHRVHAVCLRQYIACHPGAAFVVCPLCRAPLPVPPAPPVPPTPPPASYRRNAYIASVGFLMMLAMTVVVMVITYNAM